jgi:peptidoglycan hydrolase-like protein with peptidoglycan-binding domain
LLRERAASAAKRTSSTFFTLLGVAALTVAVGVSPPAEAKKRKNAEKQVEAAIPDPADGEPMILVVSLSQQKLDVYRGMTLITSSKVSTGMRGYATKAGVFSILEKRRMHHSNLYSGAPMPFMNRITWSGTALHAGVLPGYPASHGCIRLPFSFAPKLFGLTTVGDNVIVARDRPAPQLIEHANLFQPAPPPAAPAVVKQEEPPKRQSGNNAAPIAPVKTYPGKLARADVAGTTTDIPSSLEAEAIESKTAAPPTADPAAIEDTHAHAFDPLADIPAKASSRDGPASDGEAKASGHALDDGSAPEPSRAKAEAAPASPAPATDAPAAALNPLETMVSTAAAAAEAVGPPSTAEPTPAKIVAAPAVAVEPVTTAASEPKPAARVAPPALPVEAVSAAAAELKPADAAAATQAGAAPASTGAEPGQALALLPQAAPVEAKPLLPLDTPPSIIAAKLMAGAKEMAVLAAEPRSTAPLRILVTRRTQRDRIIGVQRIFADMGYIEPQDFDGTLGKATVGAIKKFQAANGMPETGAINDELVKKVYDAAGKGEPPAGHLYVRQEFGRVFDAAVSFKDPETPLGTHLFTAMKFAPGDASVRWTGMSLQGDDSAAALDRLEIPSDVRQKISERLTPGSSLIIGDTSINTAGLTKGNDFVVWAKDTPAKITAASLDGDFTPAKPKKKKKAKNVRRPYFDYGYNRYQRGPGVPRGPAWPW